MGKIPILGERGRKPREGDKSEYVRKFSHSHIDSTVPVVMRLAQSYPETSCTTMTALKLDYFQFIDSFDLANKHPTSKTI